ncbi:MAG: hypothetical protein KJZ73_11740 [Pseudorhodoplanes sp.]|nr:hypothetical protein [Pseudorhodoplanes sp.]GIK81141.1 MAG: hypothetical protein BroJett024_22460 [Alphaproteobacteria bacterium]
MDVALVIVSDIWQFIKDSPAVISALTALAAVIIGPVVTYKIAKKQLFANVVSQNRIRWVEALREDIAAFVAAYARHITLFNQYADMSDDHEKKIAIAKEKDAIDHEVSKRRMILRLKLNPEEDSHAELLRLLDESILHAEQCAAGDRPTLTIREMARSVVTVSRKILKHEWDRAKKLR